MSAKYYFIRPWKLSQQDAQKALAEEFIWEFDDEESILAELESNGINELLAMELLERAEVNATAERWVKCYSLIPALNNLGIKLTDDPQVMQPCYDPHEFPSFKNETAYCSIVTNCRSHIITVKPTQGFKIHDGELWLEGDGWRSSHNLQHIKAIHCHQVPKNCTSSYSFVQVTFDNQIKVTFTTKSVEVLY